jgi:hypothetical protein
MDYSAEAAGAVCERTLTSAGAASGSTLNSIAQDMASGHWTRVVEEVIDLRSAMPKLSRPTKRQVATFMVEGYQPGRVDGRYPDPQALAREIADRAELAQHDKGSASTVAMLRKELREVRTCRTLAVALSGRNARAPIMAKVDRKLRGKLCARCHGALKLGQSIFVDRDWHSQWHVAGGCVA